MIEIVILFVFFGGIVTGSLVAAARGRLPTSEQLEAQDRIRMAKYERAL